MNTDKLLEILNQFAKSIIQSEAEVRSKLIVPLIEWLGYPIEYRAEEFPIYGFEGGKRIPAKNADFLLFSDSHFADHRSFSQCHIEWVQSHSLLIFEAKKPGEMPAVLGQPQYYSIWSKSLAYLETDGKTLQGYVYDEYTSDKKVISCNINELPYIDTLYLFSYETLKEAKLQKNQRTALQILASQDEKESTKNDNEPTSDNVDIIIPPEVAIFSRNALGKNSTGLSDCQAVERFLRLTDSLLMNDIRYEIPEYMISIPRRTIPGKLSINGLIIPIMQGDITQYYRNEDEILSFSNEFFQLDIILSNDDVQECQIRYCVNDMSVDARLTKLRLIERILDARRLAIFPDTSSKRIKPVYVDSKDRVGDISQDRETLTYWMTEQEKLKTIEEYYNIRFILETIGSEEETTRLYAAVDFVFNSICQEANCHLNISKGTFQFDEPIVIDEPVLISTNNSGLDKLVIHNFTFVPRDIYWLPCTISKETTAINAYVTFDVDSVG